MTKKAQRKSPESCPKCGSLNVVPIYYGLPGGPEVMEAAKQGKIALGGCLVTGSDPQKQCQACGTRFDRPPRQGARREVPDVAIEISESGRPVPEDVLLEAAEKLRGLAMKARRKKR
jgi:hypothetical protein